MAPKKDETDNMDIDKADGKPVADAASGIDEFPPFENDPEILAKIKDAVALVDTDGVLAAMEKLLALERINRGAGAAPETAAVCVHLLRVYGNRKDWGSLSDNVVMLSKRRAQLKMAVTRMVQEAMSHLPQLDIDTRRAMLETLRDVTAGKIFVEMERAKLTRTLAEMRESEGDIEGAATIMQEVQVETFGGMLPREKFDFILEQVRLSLEKNDFIRGAIIAKKILPRQLNKPGITDIKMRYYSMMVRIHARNTDYLQMCMAYLERFDTCRAQSTSGDDKAAASDDKKDTGDVSAATGTKVVKGAKDAKDAKDVKTDEGEAGTEEAWMRELKLASLFVMLSPRDSTQVDLLHRVQGFKAMEELPVFCEVLKLFSTDELIRWPVLMKSYRADLGKLAELTAREAGSEEVKWETALQERVTEHNLRVLSKYYSRIRLQRLAELLDMSEDDTERKLAAMVSDKKALWARIDRPSRIVTFAKPKDADAILNGWATNVSSLLDTVEKTCHLVHRETMVHAISATKVSTDDAAR